MEKNSYLVPLCEQTPESYEANDNNLIQVKAIRLDEGDDLVEISITRDGMLGLATELIRSAIGNRSGFDEFNMEPLRKDDATRTLGVYLHPDSNEVRIMLGDLPTVQELMDASPLKASNVLSRPSRTRLLVRKFLLWLLEKT